MTGILKCDTIQNSAGAFEHARLVQVVNTSTGALVTGTTITPDDDTIPQNNEGVEMITLAITPTHASNKLLIEAVVVLTNSAVNVYTTALFQDSTAGALACTVHRGDVADGNSTIPLTHYMTAGTTSSTTFKIRCGGHQSGTIGLNSMDGGRVRGGAMVSSITISEIRE
jgi:hypothetical protein